MNDLRKRWDARWCDKSLNADWQADSWLKRIFPLLVRGQVLDVACGAGRNAIYLAEQHFDVTAVDLSPQALEMLAHEAADRGLVIKTLLTDLESEPLLPEGPFDLVIDFFYLYRPLLPELIRALRPGGLMVIRTFSSTGEFAEGDLNQSFVLQPGELLDIFRGWEILLHEDGLEPSSKGGSLAGIVARKNL